MSVYRHPDYDILLALAEGRGWERKNTDDVYSTVLVNGSWELMVDTPFTSVYEYVEVHCVGAPVPEEELRKLWFPSEQFQG